jgi:hypothetical protein
MIPGWNMPSGFQGKRFEILFANLCDYYEKDLYVVYLIIIDFKDTFVNKFRRGYLEKIITGKI